MALQKKLMCFKTQEGFDTQLAEENISEYSIVFIQDTQRIWTHGTYFSSLKEVMDALQRSGEDLDALKTELTELINTASQTAQDNLESAVSDLELSISDTAETAQSNLETAVSELEEKIAESGSRTTYTAGDNIVISDDNVISTSGVYDISETDSAISSAIDNLKGEIESDLSGLQSDINNIESAIPSVEAGENISVTKDGTVYTVGCDMDAYTKSETDSAIKTAVDSLQTDVDNMLDEKQDILIPGENVTIIDNVISATGAGITDVSVTATAPLTLEGVVSENSLTLSGSVDTYDKSTIDKMMETATSGGITSVSAEGSGALVLGVEQSGASVTISGSVDLDGYATTEYVNESVAGKQDILTPGENITITDNVISAVDTGVTAVTVHTLNPLSLTGSVSNNRLTIEGSVDLTSKQDVLTAGDNITIEGNVISADSGITMDDVYDALEQVRIVYAKESSGELVLSRIDKWQGISSGQKALGVAVLGCGKTLIVALETESYPVSIEGGGKVTVEHKAYVPKTTDNAVNDLDGYANTKQLEKFSQLNSEGCVVHELVNKETLNESGTGGLYEGSWYVPSVGELSFIAQNINAINHAIELVGGTAVNDNVKMLTSTLASENTVYTVYPYDMGIFLTEALSTTESLTVWPVAVYSMDGTFNGQKDWDKQTDMDDYYTKEEIDELLAGMVKTTCVFSVNATPDDATVVINGEVTGSVTVAIGSTVTWEVSKDGYESQEGTMVANDDTNIVVVSLTPVQETSQTITFTNNTDYGIQGLLGNVNEIEYGTINLSYKGTDYVVVPNEALDEDLYLGVEYSGLPLNPKDIICESSDNCKVEAIDEYAGYNYAFRISGVKAGSANAPMIVLGKKTTNDVSVTPSSLEFTSDGGTDTVVVACDGDWTAGTTANWISVDPESGSGSSTEVSVKVNALGGAQLDYDRDGTVTFTSDTGETATLSVHQDKQDSTATPGNITLTEPTLSMTNGGSYDGTGGETGGAFTLTTGSNTTQVYVSCSQFGNPSGSSSNMVWLSGDWSVYESGYVNVSSNRTYNLQFNYQNRQTPYMTGVSVSFRPYNNTTGGNQVSFTITSN